MQGLTLGFDGSAAAAAAISVTEIVAGACFAALAAPALTVPITNFSKSSFASCGHTQQAVNTYFPQHMGFTTWARCSVNLRPKVTT